MLNKQAKSNKNSEKSPVNSFQEKKMDFRKADIFYLMFILLITLLCFLPLFQNQLVNWDDDKYITENYLIREFNLKAIFTQPVLANYHPITILVYTAIFKFFGLDPFAYHSVSLLLHLTNTLLVFFLIKLLFNSKNLSFLVALFFGISPIHVESVAWASELKDLLYAFFFLLSLICYVLYANNSLNRKYLLLSVFFFLFSVLSKAMAVSLLPVIILHDFMMKRKMDLKILIEKIPFLIISVVFGIIAILTQKEVIQDSSVFSFFDRILFASYGFVNYILKIIAPVNLYPYYPYPEADSNSIPAYFYFFPVLAIGILAIALYSLKFTRKIFWALAFFAVTIFLVLQLLPVGDAIMADRYAYIPSIGIIYLLSSFLIYLKDKYNNQSGYNILIGLLFFAYGIKTFHQNQIWKNSVSLWSYAVKYPNQSYLPYSNLANALDNEGDYEGAIENFTRAIEKNSDYIDGYLFRGVSKAKINDIEGAIKDFDAAIKISPLNTNAYFYRANAMISSGNYPAALKDFKIASNIDPAFVAAYYNSAILKLQLNDYVGAISDFDKTISLNKEIWDSHTNRGNAKLFLDDYEGAIQDYNVALNKNPNPSIYNNRGIAKFNLKDFFGAIDDYDHAITMNSSYPIAYFNRAKSRTELNENLIAIEDYTKALSLNPEYSEAYFNRAMLYIKERKMSFACDDLLKADSLGYKLAKEKIQEFCR
jgi:tetratricopeptide (TPR) repeat protein